MGLLDRFTGGSSSDESDRGDGRINDKEWVHDHYEVKRSGPESNGGWTTVSVAGQEEWGYPISEREFRANMPDPDPGKYRLWSVDQNGIHHPPRDQDEDWVMQVEDDGLGRDTGGSDPQISQLEQKVDALTARLEDGGGTPQDPDKMVEYAKAQIAMGALNSKQFLDRFGAQIAMGVLGGEEKDDGDISFDEWRESPVGATIYESLNDPQKVEDLGEAFGSASSNFMSGFMEEFGQGDGGRTLETGPGQAQQQATQTPDPAEQPEPDPEPDPEPEQPDQSSASEIDGGPSSLDDLADNIPDEAAPDMEEVTREFAETNMAMQDQRGREDSGAESEMPDPERAANGHADEEVDLHTGPDPDPEPPTESEPDPDPTESFEADDPDDVSDEQSEDTEDADGDDDSLDPETPSELRALGWNELQQVASRNGLNPTKFDGAESLRSELEQRLFGTPSSDNIEDAAEELSGTTDDTDDEAGQAETSDENPSPDAIAEGL